VAKCVFGFVLVWDKAKIHWPTKVNEAEFWSEKMVVY